MTLIVSLRVPDGVVIAGDSLQTVRGSLQMELKQHPVDVPGHGQVKVDLKLPALEFSTSTYSYAQKIFPFKKKFGMGAFGSGIINQRTIYNHIRNLERTISEDLDLMAVAEKIKDYFWNEFQEDLKKQEKLEELEKLPDATTVFGMQIIGYKAQSDYSGHTIQVTIGKEPAIQEFGGIGCTVSGETNVTRLLWQLGNANYGAFSLQDAVDYAEFLINTTATHQRFANMIPTVGGFIDVALLTNYNDFRWIRCKKMTKIIEGDGYENDRTNSICR
jgi:hypothetical protein